MQQQVLILHKNKNNSSMNQHYLNRKITIMMDNSIQINRLIPISARDSYRNSISIRITNSSNNQVSSSLTLPQSTQKSVQPRISRPLPIPTLRSKKIPTVRGICFRVNKNRQVAAVVSGCPRPRLCYSRGMMSMTDRTLILTTIMCPRDRSKLKMSKIHNISSTMAVMSSMS
jgi:hypothetical protein